MRKAIAAVAAAAMLACTLGLAACSGGETSAGSAIEVESVVGIEIEGTLDVDVNAAEDTLEINVDYDTGLIIDGDDSLILTGSGYEYALEDGDGYDSVYDAVDDEVEITYADGSEASSRDLKDGMSVTVVIGEDDEGYEDGFESIVINE